MKISDRALLMLDAFVYVSRLGAKGYQDFYSGRLEVYILPDEAFKVWVIAYGTGERHIFNGYMPKYMAVSDASFEKKKWTVTIAKVPSLTYTNDQGLPIPTIWKFRFHVKKDYEKFLFFMSAASSGFYAKSFQPTEEKNIFVDKTNTKVAKKIEEKDEKEKKEMKKTPRKLVIDLPSESDGSETDFGSIDSPDWSKAGDSIDSLDSPVFAESQDVYASMAAYRNNI